MSANDSLGDRMKASYEDRYRVMLPRRTFTVLRCDGKSFHTFTRQCEKPYDLGIVTAMDAAMLALCKAAQGAAFGYVQSDEISVLLADFQTIRTDAWFDGNLQKLVSVAASVVTAAFNAAWQARPITGDEMISIAPAHFDCRAFVIPDPIEVENYMVWRQQDAVRNSIQGLAQAHFSAKALHGISNELAQEMLFREKGINWNDRPTGEKRGRCAVYEYGAWRIDHEIPVFTQDRAWLRALIPTRQD